MNDAAFAKLKLGQYKAADLLYTQALAKYGTTPPVLVLANATVAKQSLTKAIN